MPFFHIHDAITFHVAFSEYLFLHNPIWDLLNCYCIKTSCIYLTIYSIHKEICTPEFLKTNVTLKY